jgi:hypothetical protein
VVKIPSYRRHKPSKQAVVTIRGKDFYLGKNGTKESHQAYNELVAEYLKLRGQDVPPEIVTARRPSKNITVIEAADRYLAHSDKQHGKAERAHVRGMLRCVVKLFENEKAAAIGPAELREIRKLMVEQGWSRTYVNEQVGRVKRMYKWLAAEPLIPITTYQALRGNPSTEYRPAPGRRA